MIALSIAVLPSNPTTSIFFRPWNNSSLISGSGPIIIVGVVLDLVRQTNHSFSLITTIDLQGLVTEGEH